MAWRAPMESQAERVRQSARTMFFMRFILSERVCESRGRNGSKTPPHSPYGHARALQADDRRGPGELSPRKHLPKGHADPAWRLCAALLLATAGDLTVNRADRVALKVQYPRTPQRPGVPRERERGPLFLRETWSRTSYERGSETTRRGFLESCLVTRK